VVGTRNKNKGRAWSGVRLGAGGRQRLVGGDFWLCCPWHTALRVLGVPWVPCEQTGGRVEPAPAEGRG
jgi:hypothetical protein